jgi:hypothetical protein
MRVLRPVALVSALAISSLSYLAVYAAEGDRPFGGPPPQRSVEERPFGGPPPQRRGIQPKTGTSCKTPAVTCKLQSAQPVGGACSCPGGDGKPVSGMVE